MEKKTGEVSVTPCETCITRNKAIIGRPIHSTACPLGCLCKCHTEPVLDFIDCCVKNCDEDAVYGMTMTIEGLRVELYACEKHFDVLAGGGFRCLS